MPDDSPPPEDPAWPSRLAACLPIIAPAPLALALTAWRYDAKPLWRDEVYTLVTAGRPLPEMVGPLSSRDAGLSVHYLLMHV